MSDPQQIAEAIARANRVVENDILKLQGKIRSGFANRVTLHKDSGHVDSAMVHDTWMEMLE